MFEDDKTAANIPQNNTGCDMEMHGHYLKMSVGNLAFTSRVRSKF